MTAPRPDDPSEATFRWQTFFQHAGEPIFLLNARRRLLFANRAWEACTGLTLAKVRGQPCRRSADESSRDAEAAILAALAPPPEALRGEPCQVQRRAPGLTTSTWWEISYFPLPGKEGLLGILGRIRPQANRGEALFVLPEKLAALRGRYAASFRLEDIGGDSPALHRVREQARLAAQARFPVLLLGEPGVGKEWLARVIHHAGPERTRYFARVDCTRLPASVLEEVLFGPRSSLLSLGTLYLQEPAALPRETQARLVRFLAAPEETQTPRLIAGSSADPRQEVQAGRLLEELACRLSTLTIALPPLRERKDELARLIDVFLRKAGQALEREPKGISPEARQVLETQIWPGNLRELSAVLLAASQHASGGRIELADLSFHLRHGSLPAERKLPLDALLAQAEKRLIELALRLTRNHRTRAAELLGIWPPRLIRRMKHFGLLAPDEVAEVEEE